MAPGLRPTANPAALLRANPALILSLRRLASIDWSIRGLESLGVPPKEAPHLLGHYAVMQDLAVLPGAVLDESGELRWHVVPQVVDLFEQVRLYENHPGIPPADARRLARSLALAWLHGDEAGRVAVEAEERFEPWRSKEHTKVYKDYISRRRSRTKGGNA